MFDHRHRRCIGRPRAIGEQARHLLGQRGDQGELGDQFGRLGEQQTPDLGDVGEVVGFGEPPHPTRFRSGAEAREQAQQVFEQRRGVGGDGTALDHILDRERHIRIDYRHHRLQRDRRDQCIEQQRVLVMPVAGIRRQAAELRDNLFDPPKHLGARGFRQRRRHQIDPQRAILGGHSAGELDPPEPAIGEFANNLAGRVEQSDVGGSGSCAEAGYPKPGATSRPPERGGDAHPPEAPRQETGTLQVGMVIGNQREQGLQGAIHQGGVDQVAVKRLVDDGCIEVRQRFIATQELDSGDGAKLAPVIEPELGGKAIEGLGVNFAPSGFALGEQRRGLTVPGGRETRHRMERQRLIRKTGPAAQLPIAILSGHDGAYFARPPLVEGQRSTQLDIDDFDGARIRAAQPRRGERHLEDRGGGQHRHALDGMIGQPGQHFRIEMVEPERYRPLLPKAEQRMVEGRIDRIGAFDRPLEPEALLLPRIQRQPAQISRAVKPVGPADVMPGDVAPRGDFRKRVVAPLLAAQCGEDPALTLRRAERVVQIRLENGVCADLDK